MFVQNGPFWVLLSLFPVVSYNIGSKDISISGLAVTYYFQLTVFRWCRIYLPPQKSSLQTANDRYRYFESLSCFVSQNFDAIANKFAENMFIGLFFLREH